MPHTPPGALPRRPLLLALAITALGLSAHAQALRPLSTADAKAVRAVVEAQLKAFAADDAAKAFSHAAPAIQQQFGDAPTFMRMVREAYPVVYRPAATAFFKPEWVDEVVRQVVQMRDAQGALWLATYQLVKQPDGRWRIAGCVVQPDAGKGT